MKEQMESETSNNLEVSQGEYMTTQSSTAATTATAQPTPTEVITQLAFGALMSQALYVAAKLGVADLLAEKPQPVSALCAATNTNERALYRVLRSLSSIGIFEETNPKVFSLTPLAELLRSDANGSLRNGVIFAGEEWHWRVWGNLLYSVQTGKPAWGRVHGAEVFDYFAVNPEQSEIFNHAMTDGSTAIAPLVAEAYDFSGINRLTDIAGGHGYLLAQILKANPNVKGILFDVPPVIAGASALLEEEGVAGRVEKVSGDFFASVPEGADAYIMKHIIHDWDDEHATKILKNCRDAIKPHGKLLVIDQIVGPRNQPGLAKLMDLEMLVNPGGLERTEEQWKSLFAASGFRLSRIVRTPVPQCVIEGIPADRVR
jgi:SAM-dependent methyltransferase